MREDLNYFCTKLCRGFWSILRHDPLIWVCTTGQTVFNHPVKRRRSEVHTRVVLTSPRGCLQVSDRIVFLIEMCNCFPFWGRRRSVLQVSIEMNWQSLPISPIGRSVYRVGDEEDQRPQRTQCAKFICQRLLNMQQWFPSDLPLSITSTPQGACKTRRACLDIPLAKTNNSVHLSGYFSPITLETH